MRLPSFPLAACALLALAAAGAAQAQQPMFRIVGPDGRVTYTDRAPTEGVNNARPATPGARSSADAGGAALPFEVRQVANRYPVTLYTGKDCAPCQSARNLLVNRGVPFTERTVDTNEDIEALQRLSGDTSLPFGTIGGQQIKGFSDLEWSQYLDAAGYAKVSQLPPNYRQPPATPLVAAKRAEPPAAAPRPSEQAAAQPAPAPLPPPTPARDASNPAGIRF